MATRKTSSGKSSRSSSRKSGGRRYGKAAGKSVESAMRRRKRGTLKSGIEKEVGRTQKYPLPGVH